MILPLAVPQLFNQTSKECTLPMRVLITALLTMVIFLKKKEANCYKRTDRADSVRDGTTALDVKDCVRHLGLNPEWEKIKAPTLRSRFAARMNQHPDMLEGLLNTAPYRLIEVPWDTLSEEGAFDSKKYDNGHFDGLNQFGDTATGFRDQKLKERQHAGP